RARHCTTSSTFLPHCDNMPEEHDRSERTSTPRERWRAWLSRVYTRRSNGGPHGCTVPVHQCVFGRQTHYRFVPARGTRGECQPREHRRLRALTRRSGPGWIHGFSQHPPGSPLVRKSARRILATSTAETSEPYVRD